MGRRVLLFVWCAACALTACASADGAAATRAPADERYASELADRPVGGAADPRSPESVEPELPEPELPEPGSPEPGSPEPGSHRPGWFSELVLRAAPFHEDRAPSAVVRAPPGFDRLAPLDLVVFLHGWRGCARQLMYSGQIACRDGGRRMPGWDLGGRFDDAGVNAVFVIPQLAFLERDGSPGEFLLGGRFADFLGELLGALGDRVGAPSLSRVRSVTLVAHSAGYETTLALLSRGDVPQITRVVLFDALYRGHQRFGDWVSARADRRLVSLHGPRGRTASQNQYLAAHVRALMPDSADQLAAHEPGPLPSLIRDHRVVIAAAEGPHGEIPARYLAEVLRALLGVGVVDRAGRP